MPDDPHDPSASGAGGAGGAAPRPAASRTRARPAPVPVPRRRAAPPPSGGAAEPAGVSDALAGRLVELRERLAQDGSPVPPQAAPVPAPADAPAEAPAGQEAPRKVAARTPAPKKRTAADGTAAKGTAAKAAPRPATAAKAAPRPATAVKAARRPATAVKAAPRPATAAKAAPGGQQSTPGRATDPMPSVPAAVDGPAASAGDVRPAPPLGTGLRVLVALTVLLLAAAAGLGAAAAVESGPMTWEVAATVQLAPGDAPSQNPTDALAAGVARYRAKVTNRSFTALSAFRAGLPAGQVREQVTAGPGAKGELRLTARAATVASARALAAAAVQGLIETVTSDQQLAAPSRGDRLTASGTGPTGSAVRVAPRDRDAWLAGGLTAGAVLLFTAVALLLRRGRSSAR